MHLLLFIQSLGLIYLVDISLTPTVLDYLFNGVSYLMVFSQATYNSKSNPTFNNHSDVCKGHIFFVQFELPQNIQAIGLANLLLVICMVVIAVFKTLRKKCVT